MPYPLPEPAAGYGDRIRLLPPSGCPGEEQWVVPHEVPRWLELAYRLGPVPADPLELFWLPSPPRWNDPIGSAAIELLIHPRGLIPQPIQVSWGDGHAESFSWSALSRQLPRPRHIYLERSDLTLQVQIGLVLGELEVALLGCPVPPALVQQGAGAISDGSGVVQPLVPGDGIAGAVYDGRQAVVWKLRLHPEGGLALLPSPVDGEPALVVVGGSGAASRGTRWYSGDGAPLSELLLPAPAPGDFYLDRLSGQVYELVV